MSKSSKTKSAQDKQLEERILQFVSVTGSTAKDARKYLEKFKRLDQAIDSFYNNPHLFSSGSKKNDTEIVQKLSALFEKYKDPDGENISIDGTIKLCEDLEVNPEDVVLLSVAYELKSPSIGEWTKKGWVDGWKALDCDSIESIAAILPQLSQNLSSDPKYFQQVYSYTFDLARSEGQRSLALDTAQEFWKLLIPHGLQGGALAHVTSTFDGDNDVDMDQTRSNEEGWKPEFLEWWFEFLRQKGGKGISKDTWTMFMEFVRMIDSKFQSYDETAAWPSTIDDFVSWARERIGS